MAATMMSNVTGPQAMAYGSVGMSFGYPEGMSVTDMVPDQIKHMVHPHWNKFPPVNPMWHYLLGVAYLFLGAISLFGNGMVILLFLKNKNLRSPANYLVANLAFSDMCMMISQFPFFAYNCFSGGVWMFSPFFCELYACLGSIFGLCSIWSLVFISYDRYNVIVNGVGGSPLTSGKALIFMLFSWAYAVGWSIPPFFGWGKYIPEGILDSCSFDYLTRDWNLRSFGICIFVFDYCVPLFVILFAYMFIVKAIVAHEKAMREQAKKMNVSNLRSNAEANAQSAEVRIAKVAMTNVALWLICWTPYASVVVQGLFFNQDDITPIVSMLPALLAKSASVYNPIIYAINHPKFRLALMKQMPGFCIHEEDDKASGADTKSTETAKA
ncbi:compound eye opsin BCRH2-like [Portunus trituberculatus]|uniref:compound eye opsin BCRH2-like n=1 Tax=Portunus trituberculatus TaxID=210409 RepID=UPI001E1D0487|nr:compound eye opsin BCRH2-like [Portunus trituberculatus]